MPSLIFLSCLEEQEENIKGLNESILETDNLEPKENDVINTRAPARPSQNTAHGGEWVDSFEDDSNIEWVMSDHLKLKYGDALINGTYSVDPNVVGIWHFNEGSGIFVYDETDNYNNGTLGGDGFGTDLPVWTAGILGTALEFDGVDDYVAIPDSPSLRLREAFTLHVWVKPISASSNRWQTILEKGSDSYGLYLTNSLTFEVYNGGLSPVSIQTPTITLGNWYHLVATYDKYDGLRKLYLNAVLVANSTHSTNISNSVGRPLGINKHPINGDSFFNGTIDDVMIFNRALSAFEIKDLYENGTFSNYVRQANLTSSIINLPQNMQWDTLLINKTEPDKTYINITILNAADDQPIPGSSTYTKNGEIDISYIDPSQYPTIKLNATFESDGSLTPELHYWAVSWNRSNTWCDTLFGGEKVESYENVEAFDGNVQIDSRIYSSAVAAWHFDEGTGSTVYDETNNDYDGTINGAIWTTGKFGKALNFDGIDDYVNVNNMVFNPNVDFTLKAWVKISSYTNKEYTILSTAGDSLQEGFAWHFDYWNPGKLIIICNGQWKSMSTSSVTFDQWTYVAFVVKSGLGTYYIDGLKAGTTSFDTITATDQLFEIGADSGGSAEMDYFKGDIDEVTIFNHALTSKEIKSLYENGSYSHNSIGIITSNPIPLPTNMYWDTLQINKTEPQDTSLNATILDGISNQPISSFTNITGTEVDISLINPHIHNLIKLQTPFSSKCINTSILHDWSVNWTKNTPPRFIDIKSPMTINRTKSVQICINVSDREEPEDDLTLKVEYKSPSSTSWQTNCISAPHFTTDHWNYTFTPPKEAELGYYTFKVTVNDSFQYLNITTHPDLIKVLNNKPTAPDVFISPLEPKTTDVLIVTAENSTDIDVNNEISYLPNYWYRWFRNGTHLEEFDNKTLIPNTATQKDEHWCCVVYPFDGDELGLPGEAEVVIINSPPENMVPFTTYEMYEDTMAILEDKLINIFTDLDHDNLTFTAMGQDHLNVEITQENGTIVLTPTPNWFGTENITFYANDSSPIEAKLILEVTVHPTNDLPEIIKIGKQVLTEDSADLEYIINQNDLLKLEVVVADLDGDVERGMISYELNITERDNFFFYHPSQMLVFQPKNKDVGWNFINISITDNNETPITFVSQHIKIQVLNVNDPPSVTITAPQTGREFLITDNITFSCTTEDPDLLIPTPNEILTYQWYTDKISPNELGTEREIIVPNYTLPTGNYIITVMVEDTAGEKAYDSVEIVIKGVVPGKTDTGPADGKKSSADNYLWLWVVIVIIIIIAICLLFLFLNKRKKQKLKSLDITEKQVLTPEGAYKVEVSLATLAQASKASQAGQPGQPVQPQVLESVPTTPATTQQVLPTETSTVTTPIIPSVAQVPLLPPTPKPTVVEPETTIEPETPSETETPTIEPPTTEAPQLEIPPETEPIQEPTMSEPNMELPPDAYVLPEQPQPEVQEQPQQGGSTVEVPQPQPTIVTRQPTLATQPQPITILCPLCQKQIQEYTNTCPHCGGEIEGGDNKTK